MINITCAGFLGNDATVNDLRDGTPVCNFSVGCNAGKGEDGQPKTVWIECALFGERAGNLVHEECARYSPWLRQIRQRDVVVDNHHVDL